MLILPAFLLSLLLPLEEGSEAKAIAAWDVVPYQVFTGEFRPGIVAFHKDGVSRVELTVNGQPLAVVRQPTLNPQTRVMEYWTTLEASAFPDGPLDIKATAYPVRGIARALDSLTLFANSHGTLKCETIHVSRSGSDENPGTKESPVETISAALDLVEDGGKILILDSGTYSLGASAKRNAKTRQNQYWITVEPASDAAKVVIVSGATNMTARPKVRMVHWRGVSFDLRYLTYYPEEGHYLWFDACRWFDSVDWENVPAKFNRLSPVRTARIGGSYVTDSVADHVLYGFTQQTLVRNCSMEHVYGDALQNSRLILNCTVNHMGGALEHHKDLLQFFGHFENLIVYNVQGKDLSRTQGLFLDHDRSSFTNCAFVDVSVLSAEEGGPPFTQLNSAHDHVLFKNLRVPKQKVFLRTDLVPPKRFTARNVVFDSCEFHPDTYLGYVLGRSKSGVPPGVKFISCRPADRS